MECYRLKSKVSVSDKEFLIQTVNDLDHLSVVSSLFLNGNILEVIRYPHSEEITAEDMLAIVKSTHDQKKNELEHLMSTYEKVLGSGDVELMYYLGTAFCHKRMYQEAESLFSLVLDRKSDHHQAANHLGLCLLAQGKNEEAVKAFANAVELRPNYADYRNNHGEALLAVGMCRQAVEEFETALKHNIYYGDAYFNLGLAFILNAIKREDFEMYSNLVDKTIDIFNRAILISPEFKTAQYEEACEVLKESDLPRALALFKAVRDEKREANRQEYSNFYLRFLLHSEQINEQAVDDRIRFLQKEIEKNATYVDIQFDLGLCYLQQSQFLWKKGIDQFNKTYKINQKLGKAKDAMERAIEFADAMKRTVSEITKSDHDV
jgi:tetratricopeptide (TPR) repeat protein